MSSIFCLTPLTMPERLQVIPQAPQQLYVQTTNWEDLLARPAVAIVGSRKPSVYGEIVTRQLAGELAAQGVVIVSGLAYGIDSMAHQAAVAAGGLTIAVLPASLQTVYPQAHHRLAKQIVDQGGALLSEYDSSCQQPHRYNFVERNRLIAGLSQIVIVTEATQRSGSRHTVAFANEQGRDVLAVPGNINNPLAAGPNQHIRDGAGLITGSADVLLALGITPAVIARQQLQAANPVEHGLLQLIAQGITHGDELQLRSGLPMPVFNQTITMLEIRGAIRSLGSNQWAPP